MFIMENKERNFVRASYLRVACMFFWYKCTYMKAVESTRQARIGHKETWDKQGFSQTNIRNNLDNKTIIFGTLISPFLCVDITSKYRQGEGNENVFFFSKNYRQMRIFLIQ